MNLNNKDNSYFRTSEQGIEFLTLVNSSVNKPGYLHFTKLVKGVTVGIDIHTDVLTEEYGFYDMGKIFIMDTTYDRSLKIKIGNTYYFPCVINTVPNCRDFLYKDKVKDLKSRLKGKIINNEEMLSYGIESVDW